MAWTTSSTGSLTRSLVGGSPRHAAAAGGLGRGAGTTIGAVLGRHARPRCPAHGREGLLDRLLVGAEREHMVAPSSSRPKAVRSSTCSGVKGTKSLAPLAQPGATSQPASRMRPWW